MKKLIVGDEIFDVACEVLKNVEKNNFDKKNVVIVPNGFENNCEQILLKVQNVPVIFNVKILTISKFVFEMLQGEFEKVSSIEKKLLVRQAIVNSQPNLDVLKGNVTCGLVEGVLKEIERFEQGNVLPTTLFEQKVDDDFLMRKKQDLAVIFQEYINLLGNEKVDDFLMKRKMLEIDKSFFDFNFFVLGFERFSKLDKDVLGVLAQTANNVFCGVCVPKKDAKNGYIYPENLICEFGEDWEKEEISKSVLTQEQQVMKNNLFCVEANTKENFDFLKIVEALDKKSEIENVACQIKKLIVDDGARFSDISVMCGDLKIYCEDIQFVFKKFGFDFFCDCKNDLTEISVVNFLFCALKFCYLPNEEDFLKIAISNFSWLSMQEKTAVNDWFFCNEVKDVFLPFEDDVVEQNAKEKILKKLIFEKEKQPSEILKTIIFNFNLENKLNKIKKLKNIFKNAINQFCDLVECVETFVWGKESPESFFVILQDLMTSTFVKGEKENVDEVWVGGITENAPQRKFLFVLGANEGVVPSVKSDIAILNDENLKQLDKNGCIETALMSNRNERFSAFCAIMNFSKKIVISYPICDDDGKKQLPSGFIENLVKAKKNKIVRLSHFATEEFENFSVEEKAKYIARAFGTKHNAQIEVLKSEQSENLDLVDFLPSLKDAINFENEKTCVDKIDQSVLHDLCFKDNKTKVSQIETYYACPFKHFLAYGLKVKEKDDKKLSVREFGNILHKVAELFLKPEDNYASKTNPETIDEIVNMIFDEIKKDEKFKQLFFEENKASLRILRLEARRLCLYLASTQQKSKFRPKFLEVYFGEKQNKFEMKVLNQNFCLVGIVDRVDVCVDNAIVIDYKTSARIKGNCKELFYGEKIQIFVYAKALEKLKGLNVKGVYYMPIVNSFSEENDKPYFLRGKDVLDLDFLQCMDKTLTIENCKSTIFPFAIKNNQETRASGEIQISKSESHATKEQFDKMMDYAIDMVKNAIKEIVEGNTDINPKEGECERCPYLSICQKEADVLERQNVFEVNNNFFGKEEKNENGD